MFFFLSSILPIVVDSWILLRREHRRAGEEEERFVVDYSAGLPCLLLYILKHINILGFYFQFEVVALHFMMQCQKVEGMTTYAPRLEVREKRLWRKVSI